MAKTSIPAPVDLQWFAEDTQASPPEPQAEPEPTTLGQGPSDDTPEWMADLPDPLKTSKTLRRYADKATLAESYIELERRLSKSTTIPSKDSKPEDWEKFYSQTGRPKKADDYQLSAYPDYRDDPVFAAAFKSSAFAEGLSAKAASGLYTAVTRRLAEAEAAGKVETMRQRESALQELKTSWADKFEGNLASARKAYSLLFSPATQAFFKAQGLEDDPRFIADLARHGATLRPDTLVEGSPPKGGAAPATTSPDHPYAYMLEALGRS